MNKIINALYRELVLTEESLQELNSALQGEHDLVFEQNVSLKEALTRLENSHEYVLSQFGEVRSCVRFNFDEFEGYEKWLKNYLKETHYVDADTEDNILYYDQGPSILIHNNGDVYDQDSNRVILTKADYEVEHGDDYLWDLNIRNQLIENYMKGRGYYPGVFLVDTLGNVTAVDTTEVS